MKKLLFSAFTCFIIFTCVGQQNIIVDPNAELRTIPGSFNAIRISGGIEVYLDQAATEAVAVSASDSKFTKDIKTVIENNTLKIYYDGKWSAFRNRKLKAYISFTQLKMLDVSGASDIRITGIINAPALTLKFSGASDFSGSVNVKKLELELSGASDVTINGVATEVSINSSGASDVKGFALTTEICEANASGASDINITVNKELSVLASGSSRVAYKGSATVKHSKSGSSSVIKRG